MDTNKEDKGALARREKAKILARRARQGDLRAREELITSNIGLVRVIVKRYARRNTDLWDEMFAEGLRWLVLSADKYDPDKHNCCFSSFSVNWIKQGIGRYKKRIDRERAEMTVIDSSNYSEDDDGREEHLVLKNILRDERMDNPIQHLAKEEEAERLRHCLGALTEREAYIIRKLYTLDDKKWTVADVARSLGISRERVRQIKNKALNKIRQCLGRYCEEEIEEKIQKNIKRLRKSG